jgi:hypothetical protein
MAEAEAPALTLVAKAPLLPARLRVEDIDDPQLVAQIRGVVDRLFRDVPATERWTVALGVSDVRGRWDVEVRGPRGRHLFSFSCAVAQVPDVLRERLPARLRVLARQGV